MDPRPGQLDRQPSPMGSPRQTARLHAVPSTPRVVGRPGLRTVIGRYMILAVVLLAVVLLADPRGRVPDPPGSQPWDYQRERVDVEGAGLLNLYARGTIRVTGWMARSSVERLRDVARLNLLDLLVGSPTARSVGGWREANGLALQRSTNLALLVLVLVGVLARPSGRGWILAILLLLSLTFVLTKPVTTVRLASLPSLAVPSAIVVTFGQVNPEGRGRALTAGEAQRALSTAYWNSFVAHPLSRMQTGSPLLAEAPPEAKPGMVAGLRRNLTAVNDWALGRRGWERAFIASSALVYVIPFSVAIAALAMLATSAQAVLFLLCLATLVVVPLGVDRRWRPAVFRYWLLPLLGTAAVLGAAVLGAVAVMRVGQAVHRSDEYIGLLLAGSTWPIVVILLARRVLRRRRTRSQSPRATEGALP